MASKTKIAKLKRELKKQGVDCDAMPCYSSEVGWFGGDARTLYAFTDKRTGQVQISPVDGRVYGLPGGECHVRVATHAEAIAAEWPLKVGGWKVQG